MNIISNIIARPLPKIHEAEQERLIVYILAEKYGSKEDKHGQTDEYKP